MSQETAQAPPLSLRRDLLRRLSLVAFLPALLLGLGEIFTFYRLERQNLSDRLVMSTVLSASAVEQFLQSHLSAVSLLAESAPGEGGWGMELGRLHSQYPSFITTLVTDERGRIVDAYPKANRLGQSVADRAYFHVPARTGKNYLSNAFRGRGFGVDPLVAVSAPITANGKFAGVIEGSIHINEFTGLRSAALRARGQEMLILDRDHRVVHASAGLPFKFLQDMSDVEFAKDGDDATQTRVRRAVGVLSDGSNAFTAQAKMKWGWKLILLAPESSLYVPLERRLAILFSVLVIAAIGALIAVRVVMHRFAASARRILATLQALARNDVASELPMKEIPKELVPLAESINQLTGRLSTAESSNVELARLSRTDPLTGVLNRRGVDLALHVFLEGQAGASSVLAVLAFDIDLFKLFNDHYGHIAGDTVLRRVAGAIAGCLRSPSDVLGRTGGEEFVALLPGADMSTAYAVAERARLVVSELSIPHASSPTGCLTVSVGVFVAPSTTSPTVLIEKADQALYRAKREGRNRVAT